MAFVAVLQLVLHYIGWLGVILGLVAWLVGNSQRASELITGGVGFIVAKYLIGAVTLAVRSLRQKHGE